MWQKSVMAKHMAKTCREEARRSTGQRGGSDQQSSHCSLAGLSYGHLEIANDATSTMQTRMTQTPVVRKFSSNRYFRAVKQPCRQKADEAEPTEQSRLSPRHLPGLCTEALRCCRPPYSKKEELCLPSPCCYPPRSTSAETRRRTRIRRCVRL